MTGFLDEAVTLTGALASLAREHPNDDALTILDRDGHAEHATLGQLFEDAQRASYLLAEQGLEPGRVVPIVLQTGFDLVAAYFGTLFAGCVPALLAPPSQRFSDLDLYRDHMRPVLRNARPGAIVCDAELARVLRDDEDLRASGTAVLTPADFPTRGECEIALARSDSVATVQYTSGSTGVPKGIVLTHGAILENVRAWVDRLGLSRADVGVSWLPLYHDMGLICTLLMPILCRYPTVLIPTPEFVRRPALWLRALDRFSGTVSFAPNFAYSLCAKRIADVELEGLELGSWRIAVTAAEPILAATCRAFQERFEPFGFRATSFTPAYGMAEYVTVATAGEPGAEWVVERLNRTAVGIARSADLAAAEDPNPLECVGVGTCVRETEFDIRDAEGNSISDRQIGMIWIRGSSLFDGYRDAASITEQNRVEGWFRTGDLGYHTGRQLFFVSREKDLIVIGGEKYSPQDVEEAANAAAGVRDGCVVAIGVQNEARGTEDLAVVAETKLDDPIALDNLRREIRSRVLRAVGLGVRHLLLVPPGGVEKTTSGKLARRATHSRYFDGAETRSGTNRQLESR